MFNKDMIRKDDLFASASFGGGGQRFVRTGERCMQTHEPSVPRTVRFGKAQAFFQSCIGARFTVAVRGAVAEQRTNSNALKSFGNDVKRAFNKVG